MHVRAINKGVIIDVGALIGIIGGSFIIFLLSINPGSTKNYSSVIHN